MGISIPSKCLEEYARDKQSLTFPAAITRICYVLYCIYWYGNGYIKLVVSKTKKIFFFSLLLSFHNLVLLANTSAMIRLWILPVAVFGSLSTKKTFVGSLNFATLSLMNEINSSYVNF